jgi:hypothetical protein
MCCAAVALLLLPASLTFAATTPKGKLLPLKPGVIHGRVGISPPLRLAKAPVKLIGGAPKEIHNEALPVKGTGVPGADKNVQRSFGPNQPDPLNNFEGVDVGDNPGGLAPPDTEGAVGPNHYFQWDNVVFKIFAKNGTLVQGPTAGNAFWTGFGGVCESENTGDPIIMYDQFADRWVAAQFAFPSTGSSECVAVSVTGDPTGSYYQYEFNTTDVTGFGDYPKMGVWPDAYYLTINNFEATVHPVTFALDRNAMLNGFPATEVFFNLANPAQIVVGGLLPGTVDGATLPPDGAPNPQFAIGHPALDGSANAMIHEFLFHVDFAVPASSTLTQIDLDVDDFNPTLCGFPPVFIRNCVPQLGSPDGLDAINDRLMYRAAYMNFGDHESVVLNHTVNAAEVGNQAGLRWYEVQDPEGVPFVNQQGTYAPDSSWRWMASIAMDHEGNMALGYSKSDATIHPAIGVTGRLASDRSGTMGGEVIMFAGTGSQIDTVNRWGDYSTMNVDPVDGCTFWYTQEYIPSNGSFNWHTRIGSFRFPSCVDVAPGGTLKGTVTDGSNPLAGVAITAGAYFTTTDAAGHYQTIIAGGTYTVTASKYGYLPASVPGVVVTAGEDTVQDFTLALAPSSLVNGVVKDGSGEGWPLYAKLMITAPGTPTFTIFSDPVTGYYSITLVDGITYNFLVTAVSPGYLPGGGPLPVGVAVKDVQGGVVANWDLLADFQACTAPGYSAVTTGLSEDFSSGVLPPLWTTVNGGDGTGWLIAVGPGPGCNEFTGNLTGGTGPAAIINSDCDGLVDEDGELRTPSVDMSSFSSASVRFNLDYRAYYNSTADVDISTDGGTIWTNVFELTTASERGPAHEAIDITALAAGKPNVMARFHYSGFFAWWWQVDNVVLGKFVCGPNPGGLVVGNVRDAKTGSGLNGATVKNLPDGLSTTTFATPGDPNQDDGFYILFAGSGPQPFEASLAPYSPADKTITVIPNSTVRLDFSLGLLDASPRPMTSKVDPGETETQTLTLSNSGTVPVHFVINELIPWVSESPTEGDVPAGGTFLVLVTFDSTGLTPGLRQGQLTFTTAPPGAIAPVPLNFTVRFLDVLDNVPPGTDAYENYIYGAAGAGVMPGSPYPGCHPGVLNFFCPSGLVTRADMAGYIERAKHGASARPPVYTGIFSDVLPNDYNANYIQGVFDDGITVGCQGPGQPLAFCPNLPVSRGQMAVFIEKGVGTFAPPDCSPQYFTDVPCPPTPAAPYGNFIKVLFDTGVTAGCAPPSDPDYPKFCPDQNIPNEQMAVFLVKAFGLPVLP